MLLRYISVQSLIAEAGGDPWEVNRRLQSGCPGQISALAKAFHDAGQQTTEAEAAFDDARRRFEASWNRDNGDHPINDAAEVRRATESLGVQSGQLPQVAADLERVAAVLAEAQRAAGVQVGLLERRLVAVDGQLGEAHDLENAGYLSAADHYGLLQVIHELEQQAIDATTAALQVVDGIRDSYSAALQHLTKKMRVEDGYDAAPIGPVDGAEFETPEQAERDVRAALAGDQRAASRVNAVVKSITDEQRGGKVPLTPEQASVLSQLQAQQHGMSIDALWAAQDRLGDQGQMIANSWQLMSNPAIAFPQTELKPGARQGSAMVKGGAAQLPDSLRAVDSAWPRSMYLYHLDRVTNILKAGDPKFRTNTDVDRLMLRHAATVMNDMYWRNDPASNGNGLGRDTLMSPVVSNIFAAVSPDHQVVHDILTGSDGTTFLGNMTHHVWSDNGKGAASLLDWIENAAHSPDARLAGETARAYGMYIGTHSPDLLHLPGGHTLGEVSPDLVRSMAHGLAPYIGNIAGIPGGLTEFGDFPDGLDAIESGQMPVAKGMFSVLSTDQSASDHFNGAAQQQALVAEGGYARDLMDHAPNLNSYNSNLGHAMTLRGLVDTGIHNAVRAGVDNHQIAADAAQRTEYNQRRTAYEAGVKTLSSGVGLVPGGGAYAGAAISVLGGVIENEVLGPAPTASPLPEYGVPLLTVGRADREILDAVITSGGHVPISDAYRVNGRIGTPDEVARAVSGLTADEYDHELSQAVANLFARNFGNDPTPPLIPDQHMMNRYNAVVANPIPGPSR